MRVQQGKITDLVSLHSGWFLGDFISSPSFNTKGVTKFESKWSIRKKGEVHKSDKPVDPNDNSSTLVILISGKCKQTMDLEKYELSAPGDYLFYSPNRTHSVEFIEIYEKETGKKR